MKQLARQIRNMQHVKTAEFSLVYADRALIPTIAIETKEGISVEQFKKAAVQARMGLLPHRRRRVVAFIGGNSRVKIHFTDLPLMRKSVKIENPRGELNHRQKRVLITFLKKLGGEN